MLWPGSASTAPAGQSLALRRSAIQRARSTPGTKRRSMRLSCPVRPKTLCAAATSITTSGPPAAATLPATRKVVHCMPCCSCTVGGSAAPGTSNAARAAAFRKTVSGANTSSLPPVLDGSANTSGVTAAACSASKPSTRTANLPSAWAALAGRRAEVLSSSTGEADCTSGWRARRP